MNNARASMPSSTPWQRGHDAYLFADVSDDVEGTRFDDRASISLRTDQPLNLSSSRQLSHGTYTPTTGGTTNHAPLGLVVTPNRQVLATELRYDVSAAVASNADAEAEALSSRTAPTSRLHIGNNVPASALVAAVLRGAPSLTDVHSFSRHATPSAELRFSEGRAHVPCVSTTMERATLQRGDMVRALEKRCEDLVNERNAYQEFVFSFCLPQYHGLLLQQHRTLVSTSARLVRDACQKVNVVEEERDRAVSTLEHECELLKEHIRQQPSEDARERDAAFREEVEFMAAEMKRTHAANNEAMQKRLKTSEAALVEANEMVNRLQEENTSLKERLQRLSVARDRDIARPTADTRRTRSPLRNHPFQTDAAMTQRMRSVSTGRSSTPASHIGRTRATVATAFEIASESGGDTHSKALPWIIEAKALAKEHDLLVQHWLSSEAVNVTLRSHHLTLAKEVALLRSELERLRAVLRDSLHSYYEATLFPLDPDSQGPTAEEEKNLVQGASKARRETSFYDPWSTANSRPLNQQPQGSLEALAFPDVSVSTTLEEPNGDGDVRRGLTSREFGRKRGMESDSPTSLAQLSSAAWTRFQAEMMEEVHQQQESLLQELASAASALVSRLSHEPLGGYGLPESAVDTPVDLDGTTGNPSWISGHSDTVEAPTLLDWHRCRQSLLVSSDYYTNVAAQAAETLAQYEKKLSILDATATPEQPWNVRVAKKVLGVDHLAALRALVTCLNELKVESPRTKKRGRPPR